MRKYTTIQGDSWDMIAHKIWHNAAMCGDLLNCNPDYRHIVIFPAGVELDIPDIPPRETLITPPWRKK